MAFPTAPIDGQTFVGSTGLTYVYSALQTSWHVTQGNMSKDNATATTNPTLADDSTTGYRIGSTWYNSATDEIFICTNDTPASATWKSIHDTTRVATTNPLATSDLLAGYRIGSLWHNSATTATYVCTDSTNGAAVWVAIESKNNVTTVAPTAVDDMSAGYGTGSTWFNSVTNTLYNCTSAALGAAVWVQVGFTPAYAVAQLPLLSPIAAITAPIIWPLPTLAGITHLAGTFTIIKAGLYEVEYNAFHEATGKRFGYYITLVHNLLADPVAGKTFTDRNAAATFWSRIVTYKRTLLLAAGDTISLNHFTDDIASTVSGNMSIRRVS